MGNKLSKNNFANFVWPDDNNDTSLDPSKDTSKDTSDVKFKFTSGYTITVHRLLLVSKTSVFLAMMSKTKQNEINIDDSEADFIVFLNYLLTGAVQKEDISLELLKISDKYQDDSLKEKCEKELGRGINIDNAIERFVAAVKYNCANLKNSSCTFIRQNLKKLINKPEFDLLYDNKEIIKTLLTLSSGILTDVDYFQPTDGPKMSCSVSVEITTKEFCKNESKYLVSSDDLVWKVQLLHVGQCFFSVEHVEQETFDGIWNLPTKGSILYLTIESVTSYFESCSADIEILLNSLKEKEKSLIKDKRNIQLMKQIQSAFPVTPLNDLKNLVRSFGPFGGNFSKSTHELPVKINFTFYNIVRSGVN